jgi:prolyl oligopeptidase
VIQARFGPDGELWLLSRKDAARGRILRLERGDADLAHARTIVPEGDGAVASFETTRETLFVAEQIGGPSRLLRYDSASGRPLGEIPTLPTSAVGAIVRIAGGAVLFQNESFVQPAAWYRIDARGGVAKTALAETFPEDLSNIAVRRLEATSKDGTRIPLTVLERKGTPDQAERPTILTGYGGFDISISPGFSRVRTFWLEQGGAYAIANLRGGGEFGEEWHRAGSGRSKQKVFDDFIACAEGLVSMGITRPSRLAIQGGSNGGLLMGAALTQRPDLFRAVVAEVGYFDMLRYETRPNGEFNATEYGSVADPEDYRALKAYSPYHRIRSGTAYPPVLLMTGANDPRVDPMHSRKMVAGLQAVGAQALLRTSGSTGHGGGTPLTERIAEETDIYAFLCWRLGIVPAPAE